MPTINWDQWRDLPRPRLHPLADGGVASSTSATRFRAPTPDLPPPEAAPLSVPELPVAVIIEQLVGAEGNVRRERVRARLGDFGRWRASCSKAARSTPTSTSSGSTARAARSTLEVDYTKAENEIDVGVTLTEPPNGIIANLLSIEGKPEIALSASTARVRSPI